MNEFKKTPALRWYDHGDDDSNPSPHYTISTIEMKIGDLEASSQSDIDEGYADFSFKYEASENHRQLLSAISDRKPDFSKVRTMHFDESCTVPRYKLGNFCSSRNIKITRSAEKADLILYGKNFTRHMFTSDNDRFMTKKMFLSRASKLTTKKVPDYIINLISECDCDYVRISNCEHLEPKKGRIEGNYWILIESEKYQNLIDPSSKFYSQDVILDEMGVEVMDEERFRRVCEMFESKDEGNHRVAMEVMSNCKYSGSLVYLLELMRRYYHDKIYNTNDKAHVSFRSLREYLDYDCPNYERTLNRLIQNVADKKMLTESNYQIILRLILEEEKRQMEGKGDAENDDLQVTEDNWRITQVDLAPKFKSQIIWDKKEEEILPIPEGQPIFTA